MLYKQIAVLQGVFSRHSHPGSGWPGISLHIFAPVVEDGHLPGSPGFLLVEGSGGMIEVRGASLSTTFFSFLWPVHLRAS